MNVPRLLLVFVVVVLGACGSRREPESVVEDSAGESRTAAARRQLLEEQEDRESRAAAARRKLLEDHAEFVRLRDSPEYWRRRAIEDLAIKTQVLLVIPKDEISLTEVRADGLLQRRVSLEVITVFVGEQPDAVVDVYEIIAPRQEFMIEGFGITRYERQAFMSRERKAQIVVLRTCLEEDGQERFVLYRSYVPSASQLRELTEDGKKYSPQSTTSPSSCIRGSLQAVERWYDIFEMDDSATEL